MKNVIRLMRELSARGGLRPKLCCEEEQEQITELPNVLCHEAERPAESRSMAFQSFPPSLPALIFLPAPRFPSPEGCGA